VGTFQEILVDGPSKKEKKQSGTTDPGFAQWTGRTSGNKIVNFNVKKDALFNHCIHSGAQVRVYVQQAFANSLSGEIPA